MRVREKTAGFVPSRKVQVVTIRRLRDLHEMRVAELRAKGIPYEVVELD